VLGILGGSLLAIVFGIVGFRRAGRTGKKGRVMAAWGTSLGLLWLCGIIVAASLGVLLDPQRASDGGFAERGKILWSDLQTGDCVEADPGNGAHLVTVLPCESPHEVEVFDRFTSTSDDIRVSRAQCVQKANAYVGAPADAVPSYAVNVLQEEDGGQGGPAVCLLLGPGKALLDRSVHLSWPWQPAGASPTASARGAAGAVTGDIALEDLLPKDCLRRLPRANEDTVPVVPCRSRHLGEVYDVHSIGTGKYPGDAQVKRLSIGRCRSTLPRFVGAAPGHTGYAIQYFPPYREVWTQGSTTVICVLVDPHDAALVGEAKGAGAHRA
jgi:hypothetical protein